MQTDMMLRAVVGPGACVMPQTNAPAVARGFVGIAFRVPPDASRYDHVNIRPTNGRADDQERRNRSTQYTSFISIFALRRLQLTALRA
jgi:hypothetical protein